MRFVGVEVTETFHTKIPVHLRWSNVAGRWQVDEGLGLGGTLGFLFSQPYQANRRCAAGAGLRFPLPPTSAVHFHTKNPSVSAIFFSLVEVRKWVEVGISKPEKNFRA